VARGLMPRVLIGMYGDITAMSLSDLGFASADPWWVPKRLHRREYQRTIRLSTEKGGCARQGRETKRKRVGGR
jgi:hypothetical protein